MTSVATREQLYRGNHFFYEIFSNQRIDKDQFIGVRLDGRNFSKFTADMQKPFDPAFEVAMNDATEAVLRETGALLAYVQFDEVTLVLPQNTEWFGRRAEKLVSVSAATMSAHFSMLMERLATFDARVLDLPHREDVVAVLWERQRDCYKNAISSSLHWALIQEYEQNARTAHGLVKGLNQSERMMMLEHMGVEIKAEHRYGRTLRLEEVDHEGFNPITNETVLTTRRVPVWETVYWMDASAIEFLPDDDLTTL